MLAPTTYVDPLALYRAVETDLAVVVGRLPNGAASYTLGVHPRAYGRVDLRPMLARLNACEPGWGGRGNAGGGPLRSGSRLPIKEVVALLNERV